MSTCSYIHWKGRLLGEASVNALAETFKILGDTTRVRILDALSRVEWTGASPLTAPRVPPRGAAATESSTPLCVQDLATLLGLTPSAVSHQLRLLRGMRLVRAHRHGRQVFYTVDDDHIAKLFKQGLEHVEERA